MELMSFYVSMKNWRFMKYVTQSLQVNIKARTLNFSLSKLAE